MSWALNKDVYAGIGFGAPFGLVTEYDNPWLGGAQALKFDIKTYNINPSIALRATERVSIGAGISIQRMEVEYSRLAAVVSPALATTKATLSAGDTSWGWNVGALFTLSPSTKVGVSYRSKIRHTLEGDLSVRGPAQVPAPPLRRAARRRLSSCPTPSSCRWRSSSTTSGRCSATSPGRAGAASTRWTSCAPRAA
jgi:long-chain fatty acid transport protein